MCSYIRALFGICMAGLVCTYHIGRSWSLHSSLQQRVHPCLDSAVMVHVVAFCGGTDLQPVKLLPSPRPSSTKQACQNDNESHSIQCMIHLTRS